MSMQLKHWHNTDLKRSQFANSLYHLSSRRTELGAVYRQSKYREINAPQTLKFFDNHPGSFIFVRGTRLLKIGLRSNESLRILFRICSVKKERLVVLKTRLIISSGKPLICICLWKSHFPDSLNDLVDFRLNGHTTYASRVSVKKSVLNASKCDSSDWRRRGTESTADYIMSVCRCQRGDDSRSLNTAW